MRSASYKMRTGSSGGKHWGARLQKRHPVVCAQEKPKRPLPHPHGEGKRDTEPKTSMKPNLSRSVCPISDSVSF